VSGVRKVRKVRFLPTAHVREGNNKKVGQKRTFRTFGTQARKAGQ